ncbi:MAG: histidine kinase [Aquihabitans sp.]
MSTAAPPVQRPLDAERTARVSAWLAAGPVVVLAVGFGVARIAGSAGGTRPGWLVAALLIAAWTAAGLTLLRRACPLGRLALVAAVAASLAYAGFAIRSAAAPGTAPFVGDLLAAAGLGALPAIGLHLLVALPDGQLLTNPRRWLAGVGYIVAAALVVGWLWGPRSGGGWLVVVGATLAALAGIGPANQRYRRTSGPTRQRLQWIGCAVTFAGEVSMLVAVLHLLIDWPHNAALIAAAGSILIPLAMLASATPLLSRVDRLLVTTVSFTGLTGVVAAVYLLVVIGLGRTPVGAERQLLGLSMVAAAAAALLYLPARDRLTEQANRLVYGERHAPDESLRTFGSRLSRAIPMDELLLQLAESLRKTMLLAAAEVWTGADGSYDLAVSVPDRSARPLRIDATALPVVTRAGVSGTAWAEVWLADLLQSRGDHQLRVAPIAHSGELLGLVVLDRQADADAFTEEEDQALADLVRQLALALHNVNLDSALQASLDDVRRYASELQESRARIVATGDAERRKIERNLHDGAQQHLVALAVNLRLVRDMIDENPDAAEMIDMLAGAVKDTIQELRDLAHGIYPPLLMDGGLPDALWPRRPGVPWLSRSPSTSVATRPTSRRRSTSVAWRPFRTPPSMLPMPTYQCR